MNKLSLILTFLSSLLIFNELHSQEQLERVTLAETISLKVPLSFIPMSTQEQKLKYVTTKEPIGVFSSPNRGADLSVNLSSAPWEGELSILKEFYKANFYSLYDTVTIISEGIREIDGREFIQYEFSGAVYGKQGGFRSNSRVAKYIFIQYTVYGQKVMIFSFTAPDREKRYWQPFAREIMESVRIK